MRTYFKGLTAEAELKTFYSKAERTWFLAYAFHVLAGVVADLTRGY